MSASPRAGNSPFQMTAVWLFGGLSLVLGVGKLMGLWGGILNHFLWMPMLAESGGFGGRR